MIRALLLGAFATTAYGTWAPGDDCEANLAAATCKNFAQTQDFNIANGSPSTNIDMTYVTAINGAYSYIGQGPWSTAGGKTTTGAGAFPGQPSGLVFTNQGSLLTDFTCTATAGSSFPFGCPASVSGTACQDNTIVMTGLIGDMVGELDQNGDYTLYFQRVDVNPITGNSITLNWIAENACKLKVEVTFECSGSECVEVTTIVCATFAGILDNNFGKVSTECKVPLTFAVSTTAGGAAPPLGIAGGIGSVNVRHSDAAYGWITPPAAGVAGVTTTPTGGTWSDTKTCTSGSGTCLFEHTSTAAIADPAVAGSSLYGGITYSAYVRGPPISTTAGSTTATARWSQQEETLHQAKYNLTVASALAKTFNMDVNVKFHSTDNAVTDAIKTTPDAIKLATGFSAASAAGPFLARSKVEMGAIVNHDHAYLQVVAKVAAAESWFKDLKLTKVVHTTPGASAGDPDVVTTDSHITMATGVPADGECKIASSPAASVVASTEMGVNGDQPLVHWHNDGGAKWPMAFLYCESFMSSGFTQDAAGGAAGTPPSGGNTAVTAGDTLVISLSWKLAKQTTSSGKAQLLQEADAPGQNVEVSLTIQLGGGETTITTAGAGADGSADNTVTYIIIAVCVIAAALILAVVVVAFMCLRNRSQEQLVAMSPQKATVAAVYDISQPKAKADAMDV